jgi:hypothetical protein
MAMRHVETGERHVFEQRQLIDRLAQAGHDTKRSTELLVLFEEMLELHRAHLVRLLEAGER